MRGLIAGSDAGWRRLAEWGAALGTAESAGRANQAELAFPGDSEMATRMRAHAWADTPLGDPAQWPTSLAAACRICLTSSFPMVVWWGEDLYFLYNDAYLPFLGAKHPVLAKPGNLVWDEIWDIIGPALRSVLDSGSATWSQDVMLPLNRNGYTEETYWTYSFSPLYDEAGVVRGAHTEATDTTERVIGARRLAVLNELGALAGRARSVTEACDLITLALGRAGHDVPFAAAFLRHWEPAGLLLSVVSPAGTDPDALRRGAADWPVDEAMRTGRPVRVTDVRERFGDLPAGAWASVRARQRRRRAADRAHGRGHGH